MMIPLIGTTYLDTASEDIDQGLPFKVLWHVRRQFGPETSFSLGTVLVLRYLDLSGFVVA